jgi:long-chain acyl-CoA synthetase
VGRPLVGVRVTIASPDDSPLPSGAEGEVVVESGAVAQGYILGAPQERSPFRERRFWTGDLGILDDAGYLTLRGRRDAMINVGGLKVAPVEVATVLEQHPDVREAAVIGAPDARGEEVVYAVVALDGAAGEAELVAFCRQRLAAHKVPRRIEIRDELPRTASGKVRIQSDDLAR